MADLKTMQGRIQIREPGMLQTTFVTRVARLDALLDQAGVEDFSIENSGRSVTDVARDVLVRAGWLSWDDEATRRKTHLADYVETERSHRVWARKAAGWLPAIILPLATAEQVRALLISSSDGGTSVYTWICFLLANIGALFLGRAETRLVKIQMALAFGLTSVLDVIVIVLILLR
jgi:hypothetical protein